MTRGAAKPALKNNNFQQGAVVVVDALGFKGIWKRHAVENVLGSLRDLVDLVQKDVADLVKAISGLSPVIESRFLSDTVVFTVAHDLPYETAPQGNPDVALGARMVPVGAFTVELACALGALIQARGALSPVPMAFRGAIGFGDYRIERDFLVGPAIDETAAAHERANGAIVWVTPSAEATLRIAGSRPPDSALLKRMLIPSFRVPLKRFRGTRAPVVNPMAFPGEEERIPGRILSTFGRPRPFSSVWWKRRNTRALLETARNYLKSPGMQVPSLLRGSEGKSPASSNP